jgi:hypothetical protein
MAAAFAAPLSARNTRTERPLHAEFQSPDAKQNLPHASVLSGMRPEASFRALMAGLVLLAFSAFAAAQTPHDVKRLTEKVLPGSQTTYLDLVRKVFPDTEVDEDGEQGRATRSVRLRRLAGQGFSVHRAEVDIVRVRGWRFQAQGGARHLALLIEAHKESMEEGDLFDWQYALAVFRYARVRDGGGRASIKFRLVEAVDPQEDRFVDLPDELPLVTVDSGSQSFWVINHHHNAGESFRDYKMIGVRAGGKHLQWLSQGLPGLHDTDDCGGREVNSLEVAPRNDLGARYLPVELRFRTLRWKKIDCRSEEGAGADEEEASVYLLRTVLGPNKGRLLRVEREKGQARAPEMSSLPQGAESFEGHLVEGKTYAADFLYDEDEGWRLSVPLKTLPHHAARIEWVDEKGIMPSLKKEARHRVEFTVLAKTIHRAGRSNRWNMTYRCVLLKARVQSSARAARPSLFRFYDE